MTRVPTIYRNVDVARWSRIVQAARNNGVEILGFSGEGFTMGVVLEWAFDPKAQELAICVKESSWIPMSQAESFIDTIIQTA